MKKQAILLLGILLLPTELFASDYLPIDIAYYVNNDGIAYRTNLWDGDFFSTINYPAEELPDSNSIIKINGIPFLFPDKSDGLNNNIISHRQDIDLPDIPLNFIYVLGASDNSLRLAADMGLITIHYLDSTEDIVNLCLSNMRAQASRFCEIPAIRTKNLYVQNRIQKNSSLTIWMQKIPIPQNKPIDYITLPDKKSLHIFAITLDKRDMREKNKWLKSSFLFKRADAKHPIEIWPERLVVLNGVKTLPIDIVLNIDLTNIINSEIELTLSNIKQKILYSKKWDKPNGKLLHTKFKVDSLAQGKYRFTVNVRLNNRIVSSSAVNIWRLHRTPKPTKVTFDPDLIMKVNGKRVFPFGLCIGCFKPDKNMQKMFDEFVENGINYLLLSWTVLNANSPAEMYRILDSMNEHNIMCQFDSLGMLTPPARRLKQRILTYKDHPAITTWHLIEEPPGQFVPLDAYHYDYLLYHRLDPNHPCTMTMWSKRVMERFAPFADILIPDRYTIGNYPEPPTVKDIRTQIEETRRIARGFKPVWIFLQAHNLPGKLGGPDRPPNQKELRAMTYQSIIAGAKGILYFEYWQAKRRDKTWPYLKKIGREIKQLQPVLTAPTVAINVSATNGIETLLKQFKSDYYLIAINPNPKKITSATIRLNSLRNSDIPKTLFENARTVTFADSKIIDSFSGFGVHVYKIPIKK